MHIHKKALIGAVFLSVLSLGTAFAQEAPQSVSLDLNKAVRMALENNSDVKISSSELDAAKAGLDAARAARYWLCGDKQQHEHCEHFRSYLHGRETRRSDRRSQGQPKIL